jgi:CheY-like chemotaxis protein
MKKLRLICWNAELAKDHAKVLKAAGFAADSSPMQGSGIVGQMREFSPDAVVIDLDRLPSQGREMAIMLRGSKSTRHIPIVFAGGQPEKVARIRAESPDAVYASWNAIEEAIVLAITTPPQNPVRATPHMQRWNDSNLVRKLGVAPKMQISIIGAPDGFEEILGDLPEGVSTSTRLGKQAKLVLYFVRTSDDLNKALEHLAGQLPQGSSVWIIHPKLSPRAKRDFNQNDVRDRALPLGLVDYKVCSVSEEWSGLKFAWRKK